MRRSSSFSILCFETCVKVTDVLSLEAMLGVPSPFIPLFLPEAILELEVILEYILLGYDAAFNQTSASF